ncbi:MAG: EAL domain-containing protein [Pedobacter sp.]|nr:EAL domain-containing protein [Pedobacter sp.]
MKSLRVLLLEDSPTDAELVQACLDSGELACSLHRVETEEDYLTSLVSLRPDLILADYTLPGFDGMKALDIRNKRASGIPFIFVSGSLGEERAVATLVAGASDYILKDRMQRLPAAVARAMQDRREREEKARIAGELDAERKLMRALQDTARALIIMLDAQGHIVHLNPEAAHVLDQPRLGLLGSVFWTSCIASDHVKNMRHQVQMALKNPRLANQPWRARTRNSRTVMWSVSSLESGSSSRVVLCGIDITDQQAAEEKAYFLDNFDSITGLPNRHLFLHQITQRSAQGATKNLLAVILIGIPRFHDIRDSYGEDVMNQVMTVLVQRLRQSQEHSHLLGHIAENTFALAVELADDKELTEFVPALLEMLRKPVEFESNHFVLKAYGGTAIWLRDASDPLQLLQAAESALHSAENSQQGYAVYRSLISHEARQRLQLEGDLRRALQTGNELLLHYQPQVDIDNGEVIGLEALVRWQHPQWGLLLPDKFMHIAEVCGLMRELGQHVLRQACQQLLEWKEQGLTPPTVAVNVSASQFSSPDLLSQVQTALQEFGLDGSQLEIELTESATMKDPHSNIAIMTRLRQLHVTLSIDDFGTGYSNLSYLKRFPVDRLKLDQAFVREIPEDADDLAIARSIIAMARQLQLEIIAEGVENVEQMRLLAAAGCRHVQGYYFSPPVPASACRHFLEHPFPVPDLGLAPPVRSAMS